MDMQNGTIPLRITSTCALPSQTPRGWPETRPWRPPWSTYSYAAAIPVEGGAPARREGGRAVRGGPASLLDRVGST
jgi:hypothetical protein